MKAKAISKGELAAQYMPHVTIAAARRTLRTWVQKNKELKAALAATGYSDKTVLLTPAQVQLHYRYLGEP